MRFETMSGLSRRNSVVRGGDDPEEMDNFGVPITCAQQA